MTSRLDNLGVGIVLRSELSGVKPGDHIYGLLRKYYHIIHRSREGLCLSRCSAFQQYVVKPSLEGYTILQNEYKLPWSAFVGVVGMPGKPHLPRSHTIFV